MAKQSYLKKMQTEGITANRKKQMPDYENPNMYPDTGKVKDKSIDVVKEAKVKNNQYKPKKVNKKK